MAVVVRGKRGPMRPTARNVVRGEATRLRILKAARARIIADGFEALRLDDLAIVTETRMLLCELITGASASRLDSEELLILSQRFLGGYVIGLRDIRYGHAALEQAVGFVVDYMLDESRGRR